MKIYLSCHSPAPANDLATTLVAAGHKVVSTWHYEGARPAAGDAKTWGKKAVQNLDQILGADALVLIASPGHIDGSARVPGGKFVEAGYAICLAEQGDSQVFTLGGVENGMLHHPEIRHAGDVAELLKMLEE